MRRAPRGRSLLSDGSVTMTRGSACHGRGPHNSGTRRATPNETPPSTKPRSLFTATPLSRRTNPLLLQPLPPRRGPIGGSLATWRNLTTSVIKTPEVEKRRNDADEAVQQRTCALNLSTVTGSGWCSTAAAPPAPCTFKVRKQKTYLLVIFHIFNRPWGEVPPECSVAKNVCLFTTFVQSNTVLYKVDNIKNRIVKKKKS